MFLSQKEKEKAYDKRIKSLHAELEEGAKKLSSTLSDLEATRDTRRVIADEIRTLIAKKCSLEKEYNDLIKKIELKEKRYGEIIEESQAILSDFELKKKDLEQSITGLDKKHRELNEEIDLKDGVIEIHRNRIATLQGEYDILESRYTSIKVAVEILNKKEVELREKEKEVSDLIEKHGKILSLTEKNLGKIGIYVRRLQKFCNENGIGMDLIKEFNLE